MNDKSIFEIGLACGFENAYEGPVAGTLQMTKDHMLLKMLDELVRAWLVTLSPVEIGSDPEKIRLLKEVSEEAVGDPTPLVREVYREVFLRDVWTGAEHGNPHAGRTT